MADNVTGIVLDIPPTVLQNIKNADKAIKDLEQTSKKAAQNIKRDFDTTMVSGVEAFIKKVQEAQGKLNSIKMPTIDATGLSATIQELSKAMATIDKSATTGSNRLTRIANAMTALQTANPNPQMFQNIADGIAKIGNTSQQTIDNVRNLSQIMAQLASDIRTVQQAQSAQSANTATAAQYNKLYKEQANIIREITSLQNKPNKTNNEIDLLDKLRNRYAEIGVQIDKLNKKQQTAASDLARAQGKLRSELSKNISDPVGAMNYAKQAKSLNELQAAYKNLKAVMATTKPDTKAFEQMNVQLEKTRNRIDEIRKKMGEFKSQAGQAGDVAGQLARTLAATFSVSAITGYINKMIQVRAQFELQQTALRAILQNKDEADRIFMQVQQLALQSPFSIMQMTSYTKQLAAYRIESEKLVGTTKMLADVSAGLGVDMGRLILAYGQVKAANYLRATEVRQFTEAGLNIAGELANYFSELQGKMISVGDVMDMITKRMVRFEDVEEVFKRVTSAGGLFYDMQKKQSETLWGQLQRIGDAMSIMFNEIGKSNQGVISDMLTTIRSIINNWRIFATTIKVAGGFLGSFYLITKALTASKWSNTLVLGMRQYLTTVKAAITSTGALKTALMSLNFTGVATIAAAIGLAVSAVMELTSSTSALREELERVAGESMADMYSSIYNFRELAKTATDATKSYKERAEAMETLNRTYKDILPAELLEIENIRKMGEEYTIATNAIREYYTEAAKKKAQEAIANDQEQAWNTLINHLKDGAEYLKRGQAELANVPVATLKGLIGKTMLELKQELEDGTTDVDNAWKRFKQLFADTSGLQLVDNASTRSFRAFFGEYTFTVADFYDDITDIVKRGNEAQEEFDAQYAEGFSKSTKLIIQEYNERLEAVSRFHNALMNYASLQQKGELRNENGGLTELGRNATQELGAAKAAMNQYLGVLGEAQFSWDDLTTATSNNTDALLFFDDVQQRVLGGFLTNIQATATDTSLQAWAQKSQRELQQMGLSNLQVDIINLAKQSASANGMQISMLDKLKISAETNYRSAAKDAKALSEQAIDNAKKIQATTAQLIALGLSANQAKLQAEAMHGNGSTQEELESEAEWWEKLAKLYGDYEKKKERTGRQTDIWTPRLNIMQKVNKEYEKLLKYYSKEDAMAKIRSSYGDAVAEAFNGTQWADISKWGTFDAQATVDRLKKLAEVAGKAKKKILEVAGTIEAEIEIKVKESEIQKAKDELQKNFDNYELTKTLGNLGLNVDLTYMVGGQPMTLPQIRKDIEDKLKVAKATDGQEELVKTYEDYLRKVADMENKAAVERLKNYYKYSLEATSARVKLELKAQQEINKIMQDETLNADTKNMAVANVNKQLKQDLAKQAWKEFQESDIYINMFQDIERASTASIERMLAKLEDLRGSLKNLPADQVRAIVRQMEQLNNESIKRNPFKGMADDLKNVIAFSKERKRIESEIASIDAQMSDAKSKYESQESLVFSLQMQYDAAKKNQNISRSELATIKQKLDYEKRTLAVYKGIYDTLNDNLKLRNKELQDGEKNLDNFNEKLRGVIKEFRDWASLVDGIVDGLESMGALSDSFIQTWDDGMDVLDNALSTVESAGQAVADYYSGNYIGAIKNGLSAVGSLFKTIGGVFNIGDKKKERKIKRLQEKVEGLQKAYEKLQTAIEEAYTFDDYNAGYNQSMRNLQEQRAAIQEQLALEKSKKKSDKDKIREYEDALDELAEKEKELREARYEAMGSVGEKGIRAEAENFVSVWLDAYKETGDGLDALNEHWDEFFENLVMKQAASAVVSKRMAKYIDAINAAIDSGDTGLSLSQTFAKIGENLKSELGMWNKDFKAFFDAVGIKGGQGSLLLSDLQKGIQNITEPQAAAIEAYLNSMRFAVFEQNNILSQMLASIQAQYGTTTDNPMLNEVKAIRSLVADINNQLSRVIVSRNSASSSYIMKVG